MTAKSGISRLRNRTILVMSMVMLWGAAAFVFSDKSSDASDSEPVVVTSSGSPDGASWRAAGSETDFPKNRGLYVPVPFPDRTDVTEDKDRPLGRAVTYDVETGQVIRHLRVQRDSSGGSNGEYVPGGAGVYVSEKGLIGRETPIMPEDFCSLIEISDPSPAPWCQSVKLFIIAVDADGDGVCDSGETCYEGSGTLIDPKHVLTAGHCVHEGDGGDFYDVITVVPGYENGSRPYGSARSVQLHTWEGWADNGTWGHDVGVVDLDRPIGALTGWQGYGHNNSTSFYYGNTFTSAGYPGESYGGQYMYYWYGDFDFVWDKHVCVFSRGYHGQSGSGARRNEGGGPVVYAVHSSGTDIDTTNFTRVTEDKFEDIRDDFIAGDRPSSPDLIPLNVQVRPSVVRSAESLESLSYVIHNYSSAAWSDRIYVNVYLSDDDNISASDTLLDTYHFTVTLDPLESIAMTHDLVPPVIPAGTASGDYYVGVVLDVDDDRSGNNDSDGDDAASLRVSACETPRAPVGLTVPDEDCDGSFTIRWAAVPNTNAHILERSTSPTYSDAVVLYEGTSDTYEEEADLDTYYYRVRAENDCGLGDWKEAGPVVVMDLDPPDEIVVPVTDCDGLFSIKWPTADEADYYELYRSSDPYFVTKDVTKVYSGDETSYTETEDLTGEVYYRVRSVRNFCGRSDWQTGSVVIGGKPVAPASIDYPETSDDGAFEVTWESVLLDESHTYVLERSTSMMFSDATTVYTGGEQSFSVMGLGEGTHYFRVRVETPCGVSNWRTGLGVVVEKPPYDGIWKDAVPSMNFFIQTYTDGSGMVIATPDLKTYSVFIDEDISDGVDVDDYAGLGRHLRIKFFDEDHGEAELKAGSLQSYSISKTAQTDDTPTNHGIWKSPSCTKPAMNFYIQTYKTGSAIVIGTPDLLSYYVFLDEDARDGLDVEELSGKPYRLSMIFLPFYTGDMQPLDRCVEAPVHGSSAAAKAWCVLTSGKK